MAQSQVLMQWCCCVTPCSTAGLYAAIQTELETVVSSTQSVTKGMSYRVAMPALVAYGEGVKPLN